MHHSRLLLAATFVIVSLMVFTTARAAHHENEAKPTGAGAREVVKEESTKANTEESAAKEAAEDGEGADVDIVGNIEDYEAITQYDHDKVRGHAHEWQMYFQEPASEVMEKIVGLHDFLLVLITVITLFVLGLIAYVCIRFNEKRNPVPATFAHNTKVEIAWTVIPILILIAIGIPSVRYHYQYTNNQNIIDNADITLKVVGRQWYWSYEYPDHGVAFDSNIVQEADLKDGEPRLLTVDNPIVVPIGKTIRIQLTAADVIHAFDMPSMGVKQDAVPGKLNETWFKAEKTGIFYGQCSELCGKYHGFMPIELHVVTEEEFKRWIAAAKLKFAADGSRQFAAND